MMIYPGLSCAGLLVFLGSLMVLQPNSGWIGASVCDDWLVVG